MKVERLKKIQSDFSTFADLILQYMGLTIKEILESEIFTRENIISTS